LGVLRHLRCLLHFSVFFCACLRFSALFCMGGSSPNLHLLPRRREPNVFAVGGAILLVVAAMTLLLPTKPREV